MPYDITKTVVDKECCEMVKMRKLPDAEFDIMKVVWQLSPPITSGALLEGLANEGHKEWKLQTLHTLLNRLVDRGFLSYEKKSKEKIFFPLVEKEAYMQFETKSFFSQYHGGSLLNVINSAYQGESLSDDDIDELIRWANEKRRGQI